MTLASSDLAGVNDSPPKTSTLVPIEAIACPDRPLGDGPMFWNIYHLWSGGGAVFKISELIRNSQTYW